MSETRSGIINEEPFSPQGSNLREASSKQKSRRPANTAFRQQRLKAWQPILTPKTVLPIFFAIGVVLCPIGGGLLYASAQVQEIILDYSRCFLDAPEYPVVASMPPELVTSHFNKNSSSVEGAAPLWSRKNISYTYPSGVVVPTIQCTLNFSIPSAMEPPVFFYYKLTNFYQNHRRYAKSYHTGQLAGQAVSANAISSSDCTPLTTEVVDGREKPYYPCGLAPNSVFNDTFYSPVLLNVPGAFESNETYYMEQKKGISWTSDKELYGDSEYASDWSQVLVPPNWRLRYPNNYTEENHPNLKEDEAFQVWMRLAGLPTFSKLAQRNDTHIMKTGTYSVDINHNFNVIEYGGTKSIIISTRTVMGGRNPFLGIAYVVVGGICIILGTLFTITHLIWPRKLGDHTYLSWNNERSSSS